MRAQSVARRSSWPPSPRREWPPIEDQQVVGLGPQVGFIFPVGNIQGYLNVKGYKEFDEHYYRRSSFNI
jgi:hypothetical protein